MRLLLFVFAAAVLIAADPPKKTFPFPYTQEDLPNGLRLVTIPTDSPNLVSMFAAAFLFAADPPKKTFPFPYTQEDGQACSYMIGELKILELRDRAKKALDDKFSFCQFHNTVLGTGTVPLEILERQVDAYIRAAGGR